MDNAGEASRLKDDALATFAGNWPSDRRPIPDSSATPSPRSVSWSSSPLRYCGENFSRSSEASSCFSPRKNCSANALEDSGRWHDRTGSTPLIGSHSGRGLIIDECVGRETPRLILEQTLCRLAILQLH